MEENLIKAKKIDAIYDYVKEALDGGLNDVEMTDVKEGLYIRSNVEADTIWEKGCTVTKKDDEMNPYLKRRYAIGDFAEKLSDIFESGQDWLNDVANEIYDNFVE